MAKNHSTTTSISIQQAGAPGRSQSHMDWNVSQEPSTPRSEFAFMMEDYAPVWGIQPGSPFGPFNGGVAQ